MTLMPAKPWDIGGNRYPLNVTATYRVTPDTETQIQRAWGDRSGGVERDI